MKSKTLLRLLTALQIVLSVFYLIGLFFLLALLSSFKFDGWFWLAVLLIYLLSFPIYLSLMSLLILTSQRAKNGHLEVKKARNLRLISLACAALSALLSLLIILLSNFGFDNVNLPFIASYILSFSSLAFTMAYGMILKRASRSTDKD